MAAIMVITLVFVLVFCALLAVGQFFGREPITPKCNPDTCCMKGESCDRRKTETGQEG